MVCSDISVLWCFCEHLLIVCSAFYLLVGQNDDFQAPYMADWPDLHLRSLLCWEMENGCQRERGGREISQEDSQLS